MLQINTLRLLPIVDIPPTWPGDHSGRRRKEPLHFPKPQFPRALRLEFRGTSPNSPSFNVEKRWRLRIYGHLKRVLWVAGRLYTLAKSNRLGASWSLCSHRFAKGHYLDTVHALGAPLEISALRILQPIPLPKSSTSEAFVQAHRLPGYRCPPDLLSTSRISTFSRLCLSLLLHYARIADCSLQDVEMRLRFQLL